jgi:hypothetical protein
MKPPGGASNVDDTEGKTNLSYQCAGEIDEVDCGN